VQGNSYSVLPIATVEHLTNISEPRDFHIQSFNRIHKTTLFVYNLKKYFPTIVAE